MDFDGSTIRARMILQLLKRAWLHLMSRGYTLIIILGFLLMLFILGAFFYQMFFSQPYLIPLIVLFVAACFILEFLIRRKIAKNVPGVS